MISEKVGQVRYVYRARLNSNRTSPSDGDLSRERVRGIVRGGADASGCTRRRKGAGRRNEAGGSVSHQMGGGRQGRS